MLKWSVISRDQSNCITDMIEFVGKMLGASSKQDKRTLVIYYGRTMNLYTIQKAFIEHFLCKRAGSYGH